MNIFYRRAFWLSLAGASVIAIAAAVPILMSNVMQRGFEISKQSLFEPLAMLAFGAVLLATGWKWLLRSGTATKIAAGSLAIFFLLAAVSTALAENPAIAILGGSFRGEGLLAWGAYGAFFFAVLGWARRRGRIDGLLDVLLLSSVIPASYVLQQRLGLDFYPLGARDFTRPSSTLGSSLFLAAYLAILLPLAVTRCWQTRRAALQLTPWLMVTVLQVCGILVTQSRGPLLAATLGVLLLAGCHAGRARARGIFVSAVAIFVLCAASIVAINTLAAARQRAQDIPVVARLVFNPDSAAGSQTQRASRSAASRLVLWEAGNETFAVAPLEAKLLGYGPESAYEHYFPHMPVAIIRLLGDEALHVYDRMHADTLDIGLNFGVFAWLTYCAFFCAAMYAAAQALWNLSGRAPGLIFLACAGGGGALSAIAAVRVGLASAAVPAFGAGVGAGWLLFMAGCAWRTLKRGISATANRHSDSWTLLAGLISSLWIFWMDAQISIPVPTTRMISFGVAALILIVADGIVHDADDGVDDTITFQSRLRSFGICCILIAAIASWLPTILFDAGAEAEEVYWLRRTLPVLCFLVVAGFVAWGSARRGGKEGFAWFAMAAGMAVIYAAGHAALMVRARSELTIAHAWSVSVASFAGTLFIFTLCIAFAWQAGRGAVLKDALVIPRAARWSIGAVAALTLLIAGVDWRVRQADVAATLAARVSVKQPQLSAQLLEEAIRLRPYERQYQRRLVLDLLEKVVSDLGELAAAQPRAAQVPARIHAVLRNLAAAEAAARSAARRFPRDPWVIVALANVLQIEALRVLRPLDPDGGMRAAQEASQLFARAHQLFPVEPEFLRLWAQLLADQGNAREAYRLLDQMEALIPDDSAPYAARIQIARLAADDKTVAETLARARAALEPGLFKQLLTVAEVQQR